MDCHIVAETGRTVWITTSEFLRRFNLRLATDLERLLQSSAVPEAAGNHMPALGSNFWEVATSPSVGAIRRSHQQKSLVLSYKY
jgi:hypothetical protein